MNDYVTEWSSTIGYALLPWITLLRQLPWIEIVIRVLLTWLAVILLHRLGLPILQRLATPFPLARKLIDHADRAAQAVLFFLLVQVVLRGEAVAHLEVLHTLCALCLVASLTWLAVRAVTAIADTIIELNPDNVADNLQARRIQTQTKVLARTMTGIIILIGSASALMTLPVLRQLGASLLASAGVAGLVVGFAAKPVLGNLLAGLQLALAQPIRLSDVVIVQNEWGVVEEITGTYVVVRIWDQRRLIVPLQWFIENPFQNWTRRTSDLLGSVLIWVDYSLPLEPLRAEAQRLCQAAPEWDGRLCLVQVVDASERAMQLRILVSSADASRGWDLRCRVREGVIAFIQKTYPESLPRLRAGLESAPPNPLEPGPEHETQA